MNTHSDGLYGTLSTLYKRKTLVRFGVSYASCGPSSLQGGIEVSERGDVVPLSEVNLVHSCHASPFIKPKQRKWIYKQRGIIHGIIQFIIQREGTKFPWTKC